MSDLREMLLAAFQVEHKEHLEGIRTVLLRMEQGAAGSADLDEAFRRAHSLKAAARVCDFETIAEIGHRLETLFSRVRTGAVRPGKEVIDAIKSVLNAVEDWALGLGQAQPSAEPVQAVTALDRFLGGSSAPEKPKPAEDDELGAKLMAAFQVEHKEHLEGIRTILAEVDRGGRPTAAAVDEAFRRAHSLKGAARIAELHPAETVAHRLETLFSAVREGQLRLDREVVRTIVLGLDAIEDSAAALVAKRTAPDSSRAVEAIDRILESRSSQEPVAGEPSGVSRRMPITRPPEEKVTRPSPEPAAAAPAASLQDTLRVSTENLDLMLRSTGQLLTETLRQNVVTRELTILSRQIDYLEKEWGAVRNVAAAGLRELASTPGLARVARYLTLVEQQVHSLARQARSVRQAQQRNAWSLGLLGGQLQDDVRRVRMVSTGSVFQGFRKMMRDLARDEGKEIDFRVSGFEVEADRMVLQALKDPLMHVLCNAVSHGLEPPEERREKGKHAEGRVTLRLEAPGNRLQVVVEDDGRGLDPGKVAEAAVRRGFLSEEEADAAPVQELAQLLFKPGFSTSRTVTGLSGRGMGLSVVYEAVAQLQGEVDIRPRDGGGTVLVLSVPLSVSTQQLLLVSCSGRTFALPMHGIERLLRVKLQEVEMVEGKPMLLLQGHPIPVLSLAALLEINQGQTQIDGDTLPLVLVRAGAKRVAVAVDAFLEERNSLINELDEPACYVGRLAGGILLEDGSVCLVLNTAELIRTFKSSDRAPMLQRAAPTPEKRKRATVLVVDDSVTTRTLEKSILESHGYDVRIAMDGVEALAKLQGELVDLVITDIQMPRMDGFGLLEEMKKDGRLAQVPVIVVTSMERREDQERGLSLGADAYIVKRKFDHEELLAAIRQII